MLREGIDWTIFAQAAVDSGRVNLAAHTLVRAALDMVPNDILDAFQKIVDQTRSGNREVLDLVARTIAASALKGPIPAMQTEYAAAERAVTATPNNTKAWRSLGRALLDLRRYEMAIACFNRALELEPQDVDNWTDRASAMLATRRLKAALADIKKALASIRGTSVHGPFAPARSSTSRRFTEAVEASDRALALDPGNTAAARIGSSRVCSSATGAARSGQTAYRRGHEEGPPLITPVHHRAISDSEAEHLDPCAASGEDISAAD